MPKIIKIHTENDKFQNIETLRRNRDKRNKLGQFFVEGVRNINHALKYNWQINSFIYAGDKELSHWAKDILKISKAELHYEVPFKLMSKLSGKEETSELLATVNTPKDAFDKISFQGVPLVIVFDRPSSPGNLGTLIRSADALQADGLVITGHAVDVYDPEVISASTGSLFALPIVRIPSQKELIPWIEIVKKQYPGLQIVGTDESGEQTIDKHDFTKPTILLVGNETWGLSQAYKELCDYMVNIPMHGSASSLNVSCASSILLYEIDRQRRNQSTANIS